MLSLPANYDKWFYVGKGPMTLKLIRPYSQIQIGGGTNSTRNPLGSATLPNAQTSDPKAFAPDALLGAIVVKIGKDSKPHQALSSEWIPRSLVCKLDRLILDRGHSAIKSDSFPASI